MAGVLAAAIAPMMVMVMAAVVARAPSDAGALEPVTGLPLLPRTDTPRMIGGTITDQAQVGTCSWSSAPSSRCATPTAHCSTASTSWPTTSTACPATRFRSSGLISPADGGVVTDRIFLTGPATDDTSVERLDSRLRREDDRKWLRRDGSWGGGQRLLATLTNPQRPGTNWDWASPSLRAGDYRVEIRVRDDTGRETLQVLVVTVQ